MIVGFVCCQKFPCQPRKILEYGLGLSNKRLWAEALNIPNNPPHVLKFNLYFSKIGQSQDELVLMSCGLESTLGIHSLEFTKSWTNFMSHKNMNIFACEFLDEFSIWHILVMSPTWIFMSALESLPLLSKKVAPPPNSHSRIHQMCATTHHL